MFELYLTVRLLNHEDAKWAGALTEIRFVLLQPLKVNFYDNNFTQILRMEFCSQHLKLQFSAEL